MKILICSDTYFNQTNGVVTVLHTLVTSLRELGVRATDEDLATMAHKCAVGVGGSMGSARLLDEEDMLAIFKASR